MSTNFKLFRNNEIIKISCDHNLSYPVKLCTIQGEDVIFILNNKNELFYGNCNKNEDNCELNITLILYKDDIIDIESYSTDKPNDYYTDTDNIFLIRENGCIYKTDKYKFINSLFEELIILNKSNEKLKISNIYCTNMGLLFTPFGRSSLFGLGNFGPILQTNTVSGHPQEIEIPNNEKIVQLTSGQHFVVLLTQNTKLYNQFSLFDRDNWNFSKIVGPIYTSLNMNLDDVVKQKWSDIYQDYNKCMEYIGDQIKLDADLQKFAKVNKEAFETELSIIVLNNYGNIIKNTKVYTFGSFNNSMINPKKLFLINSLSNKCIKSISTSDNTSIALTFNGHMYTWDIEDLYDVKKIQKTGIYDAVNCSKVQQNNNNNNASQSLNMEMVYNNGLLVNSNNQKMLFNSMSLKNDECPYVLPAILNHHDYKSYLFNSIKVLNDVSELYDQAQIYFEENLITLNKMQINTLIERNLVVCFEYLINIDIINLKSLHDIIYFDCSLYQIPFAIFQFNKEILYLYKLLIQLIYKCNFYDINFESIGKTFLNYVKILKTYYINYDIENTSLLELVMEWKEFYSKKLRIAIDYSKDTQTFWSTNKDLNLNNTIKSTTERYYIVDNIKRPLTMINLNKFTKHNLILFNDILCYTAKNQQYEYPVNLLWLLKYDKKDNEFQIITPDELFDVAAKNSYDKEMWLRDLKKIINLALNAEESPGHKISNYRYAKYKFNKNNSRYFDCEYEGDWYVGKMNGYGKFTFSKYATSSSSPVPKVYSGEFHNNYMQGYGLMKYVSSSVMDDEYYLGNFVADKYNGHGLLMMKSLNYDGYFKNGIYQGYGCLTIQTQTEQSTYHGEFLNNQKSGYGVLDDHISGIKYIGMFANNKKNGSGILITSDGNYYEGIFTNDILMGHGLAIFQNGTYYIGELSITGPNGKGVFYFPDNKMNDQIIELDENKILISGKIMKGAFTGTWDDMKISSAFMQMNQEFNKIPGSTDQLSINPNKKFASIFKEWLNEVFDHSTLKNRHEIFIWKRIEQYQAKSKKKHEMKLNNFQNMNKKLISPNSLNVNNKATLKSSQSDTNLQSQNDVINNWDTLSLVSIESKLSNLSAPMHDEPFHETVIPKHLTQIEDVDVFKQCLTDMFNDEHHPLHILSNKLSTCFYSTYGCWKMKPLSILCNTAIREWNAIINGIYDILQSIFPILSKTDRFDAEVITANTLLYPILLTENIYSSLFVLYASKYSHYDEIYRQRILICERKTDSELIKFLQIEDDILPIIEHENFANAIDCLKIFKREYNLNEMLRQIEKTFDLIDETIKMENYAVLNADNLLTLVIYLIIKSNIPSLGAELFLLEDLMGNDMNLFLNSHCNYCFTTIKASYQHILSSDFVKDN